MASPFETEAASVFVDYYEDDHLTTAHFTWAESNPDNTYTVAVNQGLSFGLDSHLPVRPDVINLYDKGLKRIEMLRELVGATLAEAMADAHNHEALALTVDLTKENRLAIARLQFNSPSTSPRLRDAVAVLLDSHDNNPRLASHRYMVERSRRAS